MSVGDFTMQKVFGAAHITGLLVSITCSAADQKQAGTTYVSDLRRCVPASALSEHRGQGRWQLTPYETDEVSGTMIGAASFINAPDVTLPLDVAGWHAVYVGYWNPYFAYDGGTIVKIKLSGASCFRRFREEERGRSQMETSLHEVFLDYADLTDRDIVIGKTHGPLGRKAYVAYIKLVPLSAEQVKAIQSDRARTETRRLVATIDGASYFHVNECTSREHILELVEPYRHSDVAKVLWAVSYGDRANYPSRLGSFVASDSSRSRLVPGTGTNRYIIGEKAKYENLRAFAERGIIPQQVASEHVHKMGLKFDIMFRLGLGAPLPPERERDDDRFVTRHPQFRMVLRDGTVVEKLSYAFPEVREFMLSFIREAAEKLDMDGINLCFVRGPRFLSYEKPLLDDFTDKHGEDAREVDPRDPRLLELRASYMTQFVRGARGVLDEVGQKKGKRLELSVWVWPKKQNVWCGQTPLDEGLDVGGWIREGLLDSVVCQEGIDDEYIALGKSHRCKFILFTGYRGPKAMSPNTIADAYRAGVTDFAYWDMDLAQDVPEAWGWLRRVGHRDEMEAWENRTPTSQWIRLKTIGGVNVHPGLQQAAYSGG